MKFNPPSLRTPRLSDAEVEGIDVVLDTMKMHGMSDTANIVERYLIEDGVIEVSGDGDGDNVQGEKDNGISDFVTEIAKMIA